MSKKTDEKEPTFDLKVGLQKLEQPEWVIIAFTDVVDVTKIKNQSGLEKEFKKFMEMK